MHTFSLEVSHGQIAVFDARLPQPFNDWSDAHIRQGFSWRPGSVSFSTLDGAGQIQVRVIEGARTHDHDAPPARVILVPFTVPSHGEVEAATISASEPLQLQPGEYELTFEHGLAGGVMWARLSFRSVPAPITPRIVLADRDLAPPATLVMTASPA